MKNNSNIADVIELSFKSHISSTHGVVFTVLTLTLLPSITNASSLLCLPVNVVILVLLAVAFLIIVQRNLLNLSDFLHKEHPGMFISACQLLYLVCTVVVIILSD